MDNLFQQSAAPRRRLVRGGMVAVGARDVRQADMLISEKGVILDIASDIELEDDMQLIDAEGCIVSPGLVDMHQHLDKTGVLRFAPNPSGTLQGARDAFAKYARQAPPDDIFKRASRTIERCLSRGTTAIRSHVNVDKDAGFNGIEALAKLRSDWADRVKLQLVAFMIPHPGQDLDWLEANIDRAVALADAVGGTPAVAEDPERYLDILFAAAARHGRPVDLHLDEHLNPQRPLFNAVFERVRRYGLEARTVLSHASVLSAMDRPDFEAILEQIVALKLGVVTLPAANLYLQARDCDKLPPRGLTRVAEIVRAGVPIATASDNIEDPFVPTGSGDMLEIARWTLLAGHLKGDELATAYAMITAIPAKLMGLKDYGLHRGARADFLLAKAESIDGFVAGGTPHLRVFSNGTLVSETQIATMTAAKTQSVVRETA